MDIPFPPCCSPRCFPSTSSLLATGVFPVVPCLQVSPAYTRCGPHPPISSWFYDCFFPFPFLLFPFSLSLSLVFFSLLPIDARARRSLRRTACFDRRQFVPRAHRSPTRPSVETTTKIHSCATSSACPSPCAAFRKQMMMITKPKVFPEITVLSFLAKHKGVIF